MTQLLTHSFTSAEVSDDATGLHGDFSMSISGTFVGTIELQRSFDDGSTWHIVESFTAAAEKVGVESAFGVKYRFECSAYTSGTAVAALYQ